MTQHPEDLPWNDSPADNDVVAGSEEPDPAEVVGNEEDPAQRDTTLPRSLDESVEHRDTIDERLAEEIPDSTLIEDAEESPELQAPESGADEIDAPLAEPDQEDPAEPRDAPAEEAAVRVVPDDRVL
ncbi:MAG: hypothetical protein JOY80_06640 [Candidatus Dormibacteraeota bacterium]|nr:hypothetical protein [Candidatus Dormibacteraeota bacterium]